MRRKRHGECFLKAWCWSEVQELDMCRTKWAIGKPIAHCKSNTIRWLHDMMVGLNYINVIYVYILSWRCIQYMRNLPFIILIIAMGVSVRAGEAQKKLVPISDEDLFASMDLSRAGL